MKHTQSIKKSDLKIIYSQICETWQKVLQEKLLWAEGKEVELEEDLILKGYNEANTEQKKLIKKYFKIETFESKIDQIKNIDSVCKILNVKYTPPYKTPKTKEELAINAQYTLFLICKAYNGNWIPD